MCPSIFVEILGDLSNADVSREKNCVDPSFAFIPQLHFPKIYMYIHIHISDLQGTFL